MPETIVLHIYDLSQGLARQLSQALTQKQFDAVYHTGVVLYNTEYFYGAGIQTGTPGQTPYGQPIERRQLGTTTKTIDDIYNWIRQNNSRFAENNYNPMTHNCNHFSQAFCQFLGVQNFPTDILKQPEEFLNTGIGEMIGSLFGMGSPSTPQSPEAPEPINKAYESLYIQCPRTYIADDEMLIAAFPMVVEDNESIGILNNVLSAYNLTQNYRGLFTLKQQVSRELFEVLALVCTTSTIDNINSCFYPYNYLEEIGESSDTLLKEALLRYMNNFFAELAGMRDGREKHAMYLDFARNCLDSSDTEIELGALRVLFTFSRFITPSIERIERLVPFLLEKAQMYIQMQNKQEITFMNLICGAIGRILLTLNKGDSKIFNEMRTQVVKSFSGKCFNEEKAPCVKEISVYLKLDEKEEEYF